MEDSQNGIIPEAIRAIIETVFTCGKAEILAPGAGFAAAAIGRYLLGRLEQAVEGPPAAFCFLASPQNRSRGDPVDG